MSSGFVEAKGQEVTEREQLETSANLDVADLQSLMSRIDQHLGLGVDKGSIEQLVSAAQQLPLNEESHNILGVTYKNAPLMLGVMLVKDDIDAIDVYFVAEDPDLVEAIRALIQAYFEELGR